MLSGQMRGLERAYRRKIIENIAHRLICENQKTGDP
jgi:hypothetical protein